MRADLYKTLIITQGAIIALGFYEIIVADNKFGIAFVTIAFASLLNVIRNRDS